MSVTPSIRRETWERVRGRGRRAVARAARAVLPGAVVRLEHVEPGLSLRVDLRRNVMFWSRGLARFEPEAVRVLRAAVEPGGVAFDVGANVGFFATLLARRIGPGGRVVAVEPDPDNLRLLRRNLEENGLENATVVDCAIGASRGVADFTLDAATGATGRLGQGPTAGELAVGSGRIEVVPTRVETIDALAGELGLTPDLLKIDIEGGEARALAGAARTLEMARPVIVSEVSGEESGDALELLRRARYDLWDLEAAAPVAEGDRPFMVLAVPAEAAGTPRARRIETALLWRGGGS